MARMPGLVFPTFLNHYVGRVAQIVVLKLPDRYRWLIDLGKTLLGPENAKRALILNDAERRRYSKAYWSCDPAMADWIEAALNCPGVLGSFPALSLGRCLSDATTIDVLERC